MSKPKPSSKPIYTQYTRKSTSEKNANEGVYKAGIKKICNINEEECER